MKKIICFTLTLLVSALLSTASATTTYTTNYNLGKPGVGDTGWGGAVNTNFDTIDSRMKTNADGIFSSTTISGQTEVTPTTGDTVVISDASDSGNLKKVDLDLFLRDMNSGGSSGDNVSVDGGAVADPDFVSTGDIDFVDTSNTITANINSDSVESSMLADGDWGDFTITDNVATIDSAVISGQTEVAPTTGDTVLISDASDSGNFKKVDVDLFLRDMNSGGSGGGISEVSEDTTPQLGGNLDGQGNDIINVGEVSPDTVVFQSSADETLEITVSAVNASVDRSITLPDQTGTVVLGDVEDSSTYANNCARYDSTGLLTGTGEPCGVDSDDVNTSEITTTLNGIARWADTTADSIKSSIVTIDDSGNITTTGTLTAAGFTGTGSGQASVGQGLVINDDGVGGASGDTVIESDNQASFFYLDASEDLLRIGDNATNYVQYSSTGTVTFAGSAELTPPANDTLPGSCTSEGAIFIDTNATSGQRVYACESGSYVLQGGSGGSSEWTDSGTILYPSDTNGTVDNVAIGGSTAALADHWLGVDGSVVLNEQGADADIRFEGDTNANAFYLNAGNNTVGLGADPGTSPLVISNAMGGSDSVTIINTDTASTSEDASINIKLNTSTTSRSAFKIYSAFTNITDATRTSTVQFQTASAGTFGTAMAIAASNVGIGTSTPAQKLDVEGSIQVATITFDTVTTNLTTSGGPMSIASPDDMYFNANGGGLFAFNTSGADVDFRVQSDNHQNAFEVIGSNSAIRMEALANCDTIDTDSQGFLSCGTDDGGSGGGDTFWAGTVSQFLYPATPDSAVLALGSTTTDSAEIIFNPKWMQGAPGEFAMITLNASPDGPTGIDDGSNESNYGGVDFQYSSSGLTGDAPAVRPYASFLNPSSSDGAGAVYLPFTSVYNDMDGSSIKTGFSTIVLDGDLPYDFACAIGEGTSCDFTVIPIFGNDAGVDMRIYGEAGGVSDGDVILAFDGTSAVGNVGIGKVSPTQALDVNGAIKAGGAGQSVFSYGLSVNAAQCTGTTCDTVMKTGSNAAALTVDASAEQVIADVIFVLDKVTSDVCAGGSPEAGLFYNDTSNAVCYCNGTDDLRVSNDTACF